MMCPILHLCFYTVCVCVCVCNGGVGRLSHRSTDVSSHDIVRVSRALETEPVTPEPFAVTLSHFVITNVPNAERNVCDCRRSDPNIT